MQTRSAGQNCPPPPPATLAPPPAPLAPSTSPTPGRPAASPTFPVGRPRRPSPAASSATRPLIRRPFKLWEDRASPKRFPSPPPSSIPSLPYGVSVNPDFLPPLTSPPRVGNPSASSVVAPPPNSAVAR